MTLYLIFMSFGDPLPILQAHFLMTILIMYLTNTPAVTMYNCEFKGINCAQCLSLDPMFACSYCGTEFQGEGRCLFNTGGSTGICSSGVNFVTIEQCEPPSIVDVSYT